MSEPVPKPYLASYGSRAAAFLLDLVVVFPALLVAGTIVTTQTDSQDVLRVVIVVALLLTQLTYGPLMLARGGQRNGQTLGKQWVGIRVVKADSSTIVLSQSMLREGVGKGLLGLIPFFNVVDLLFPLGDKRAQAIHDKLASTYVVDAAPLPELERAPAVVLRKAAD